MKAGGWRVFGEWVDEVDEWMGPSGACDGSGLSLVPNPVPSLAALMRCGGTLVV